jgi:hypothetical protein
MSETEAAELQPQISYAEAGIGRRLHGRDSQSCDTETSTPDGIQHDLNQRSRVTIPSLPVLTWRIRYHAPTQ